MKRILALVVTSVVLASSRNAGAADVTNTITLTYDTLDVANGDPIPTPYPGITAVTVNHMGVDGSKNAIAQDVTFQEGGYGNLINMAVSPTVTTGFGMVTIIPTDPTSYLRLISLKVATKDDEGGDEANVNFYINEVFGTTTNFIAPARTEATVAGDAVPTAHTVHTFGGTPVTGLPGRGFEVLWDARNGRLALDDFKFEVISPPSDRIIVTLPNQTFTSGSGNSGPVIAQIAGIPFNLTLTAVTNDSLGSPVIDISYAGSKTITYSGPGGSPVYTTSVNFTAGQATGVAATLKLAQTTAITAAEAGVRPGVASSQFTVNPGSFTKLQVLAPGETAAPGTTTGKTGLPSNQGVGAPFNVTVNAVDANWNLVSSGDNIEITTSDPADAEPDDNTLSGGTRTFSITPATLGNMTVTATDTAQPGSITPGTSSSITVGAGSVVYPYTLTYDLGLNNNDFITEPYPGISAATVIHQAVNGVPVPPDVFFWGDVSPVNGYGDLDNVAVGPSGDGVFAGVVITPNSPSNHVRLISFDIATKDDGLGDLSFSMFIQDTENNILTSPFVSVTGDLNPNTHTHVDFGGTLVSGPVGKGLAVYWPANNSRVAIDNVQFEIIGPTPPVARADFYTVAQGGTTNVSAPGVLANDSLGAGSGPLTAGSMSGASLGTVNLANDGGFIFNSTGAAGMGGFTYRANDGGAVSDPTAALVSVLPPGALFYDDFARPGGLNELTPWKKLDGLWTVSDGMLLGTTNGMPVATNHHADLYVTNSWGDYSVEVTASVPIDGYGWAVGGRLNPVVGSYYEVFLYANYAPPGQWRLKLTKHAHWGPSGWDGNSAWTNDVSLIVETPDRTLPHTIKMTFLGNRVQVDFDGVTKIDVVDNNFPHNGEPLPPFLNGGILVGMYGTNNAVLSVDSVIVRQLGPVADNQVVVTPEDTATNLVLQGSVVTGTKTFVLGTGPTNGSLSGFNATSGAVTYTPAGGYSGPDAFTFTVSDGITVSAPGLVSITVTSAKITPTLSINNSPVTYNGSPQAATVGSSVPGVVSDVKYNGSSTVPTAAGTYAVTADFVPTDTVNYNSLSDAAAGNFVINKATPTVTVNNSPVTYNGSPRAATVVGSVAGVVSDIKYNGSSTVPTAAGTYAVTADFVPTDTVNYNSLSDAASGNFVINKATPAVVVNSSPVTYDGTPQEVDVSGSVPGVVSDIKYNGSSIVPTNAGTYAVTADFVPTDTVNYNSLNDAAAGNFVIQKAGLLVTGVTASNKVYDGNTVAALNTASAALQGLVAPPPVSVDIGFRFLANTNTGANDRRIYSTLQSYQIGSNCLALAAVVNSDSSPISAPTNFSGNGLTWQRFLTTNFSTVASPTINLTVYAAMSNNISAAGPGTVSFVDNRTGCSIYICEFTNVWFAGGVLGAIVQSNAMSGTTANPSNLLSAFQASGRSAGVAFFGSASSTFAGTPEAGWTEDTDAGYGSPNTGIGAYHRLLTTDNSLVVTRAAINWASAMLELRSIPPHTPPGDDVTLVTSGATGTFLTKDVGTGIAITTTGFTITGADANNYQLTQPGLSANITQKPLTVTGLTGTHKVYDRTTSATASGTAALSEVISPEVVTLGGTPVYTFASANAGTGIAITTTGFTLGGADAANYSLTQPGLSANITQKPLTVTGLTGDNKIYDGTTGASASGTAALNGVVNPDVVTLGGTPVHTFASADVANDIAISTTGYTISGANAGNYQLTQPALSANITTKALTVTGITASDKVYDGTTTATLTGIAQLDGVLGADIVTLSTPIYDNSVSDLFSRFDLEGLEIGDEIVLAGSANRVSKFSFEYWAQGPGVSLGNVQVVLRFYKNDGSVVPGVTPEARRPGTLLFKSKPFPIAPTDRSVLVYTEQGDFTNTAAADVLLTETLPTNFTWTVQFIGLAADDTAGLDLYSPAAIGSSYPDYWEFDGVNWALLTYFDNPPINFGARLEAGIIGTFADKNAGIAKLVTINGFVLSGVDAGNYTLSQPTTTASITQSPLIVTADNKSRLYGAANPPLTATITGFVAGETLATSGVTGDPALTTTAVPSSPPGNYPINVAQGTLAAVNYSFSSVAGTMTVISGDFDGDGIPDDYEIANGTNPNSNDAALDPDGDRLTNLQEYQTGTGPTNSSSALRISTVAPQGNDILVSFNSVVGKSYLVQRNDQYPSPAGWTDVTASIPGTGGIASVVDVGANTLPASSRRAYRISAAGVSSEPAGFSKLNLLGNSDTLLSFPFTRPESAAGLVGSVVGNVVQINGAPDWTADQFKYQAGSQPNTYYLFVRSGGLEGLHFTITGNGVDSVTVDLNGGSLSGLAAGNLISIIPYWTLGTALPAGNGIHANTNLLPVNSPTEVLLPDFNGIGKNLSAGKTFFYRSGAWRATDEGPLVSKDDQVLAPNRCVIVRHNVADGTVCTVPGAVVTSKISIPLAVWASGQQDNFVALQRPMPVSLDDSGLISSGAFVPSLFLLSHTDELLVFDGALAAKNKSASKTYFYFGGAWREQSNPSDQGAVEVFTPGMAVIIRKAASDAPPPVWINSPPVN